MKKPILFLTTLFLAAQFAVASGNNGERVLTNPTHSADNSGKDTLKVKAAEASMPEHKTVEAALDLIIEEALSFGKPSRIVVFGPKGGVVSDGSGKGAEGQIPPKASLLMTEGGTAYYITEE